MKNLEPTDKLLKTVEELNLQQKHFLNSIYTVHGILVNHFKLSENLIGTLFNKNKNVNIIESKLFCIKIISNCDNIFPQIKEKYLLIFQNMGLSIDYLYPKTYFNDKVNHNFVALKEKGIEFLIDTIDSGEYEFTIDLTIF